MLGEAVRDGLRQESYVVDWVRDTGAALAALSTASFSALVLDLGLPSSDGFAVLRWLRQNGETTPVVIVTARDRVTDRIAGLDAGADDYLIKPFDIDELKAVVGRDQLEHPAFRAAGLVDPIEGSVDPELHLAPKLS